MLWASDSEDMDLAKVQIAKLEANNWIQWKYRITALLSGIDGLLDIVEGLVIKRHNIRIWCHDCDMARLQRVVWEGHGSRLLSEVSSQPVVKKFLEAVPYIMNTIKDIHNAVVRNDLEGLMKHSGDPVPPQALSSRDANNMTVLHKAAGLGHGGILKYIVERYPQGINDIDNDGRTPLHYAASVRDEQHTYNTLVSFGADESIVDNKNKTAGYYTNRPQEIDKNLFKTLPEAPRTPSSAYPATWDWKLLDTEVIAELNKKSRRKVKASNENISSKNITNTISESTDNHVGGMKNSSTRELIKNLPDLDDSSKPHVDDGHIPMIECNRDSQSEAEDVDEPQTNEEEPTEEVDPEQDTNHKESEAENENTEENNPTDEALPTADKDDENEEKDNKNDERAGNDTENDENKSNDANNDENKESEETSTEKIEELHNDEKQSDNTVKFDDKVTNEADLKEDSDVHEEKVSQNGDNEAKEKKKLKTDVEEEKTVDLSAKPEESEESDNENSREQEIEHEEETNKNDSDNGDGVSNDNENNTEEPSTAAVEGKYNNELNEDDDDVQVQGDSYTEYRDINHKNPTEIVDLEHAKRGNASDGRNTQESLIEGIISGEAEEDSQDASITQRNGSVHEDILIVDNEIDPEVTDLINTANMEMLATLVLNGEGSRLVGRHSGNAELQAFLENVPTYMQKINRVHVAARDGNIRELQAALDRRKFAIARDPISPNGATPLHVATVFGKTNIMKYLGGRFPETLSAVDFEGRTALHYAAVIPDNGHYYNLLQQLGANSKDLDDRGHSADDYLTNPDLLPFHQLLADYGISKEAAQEMLSDKGTAQAGNGHMDIPAFQTDEGRYLAKSLGDPLIKGLTEVANVKPKDPIAFLASFLHNFPDQEKPRLGTQESNVVVTREVGEVENEQPPPAMPAAVVPMPLAMEQVRTAKTATRQRPIDVVTVDPQAEASPDRPEAAFSSANRDEHGQSMLHFAAARTHSRNALFQLLQESDVSIGYRDELYRTARDVSIQANVPENTGEIDKYVMHLAARGNKEKIMELLLEGYDHILDVTDDDGTQVLEVITQRGDSEMGSLLASIPSFEESRESLHDAIRRGDLPAVEDLLSGEGGRTLARAQNAFGRTTLHVAALAQDEEIVAYLAQTFPDLLRIGDNLERTPLHYAMGVEKMESLSRVLIRCGAKRVLKDLKGRQPTYYFMNKSDILRLKEEEETY